MHGDVFIEYMVSRRHTPLSRLIQLLVWLAVPLLGFLCLLFEPAAPYALFITAGGAYGAWQLFIRQNVEYEYILTNGELDVDKIIARRWRKRLLSVDCRKFERLAPVTPAASAEMNAGGPVRRLDVSASSGAEERWIALFHDKEGKRTLLVFQPDGRMLQAFKTYIAHKMR